MKKLFFILALSGLVFASCGKKAEPVTEEVDQTEQVVEEATTPEEQPVATTTTTPTSKPKAATTTTTDEVKPDARAKAAEGAPAPKKEIDFNSLTLEQKLAIFDQLTEEQKKATLKEVEDQKNAAVGGGKKTPKKK